MAKVSRPVLYVGLAAVVVVAWVFLTEEDTTSSVTPTRLQRPAATTNDTSGFTEEDRTAKGRFLRVDGTGRNVFLPLVARATSGISAGRAMPTNMIPPEFAGGEQGWAYTGTATIDGRVFAGLENKTTGETVLLVSGQRWKNVTVNRVTDETLVLQAASGLIRSIALPELEFDTFDFNTGFRPLAVGPDGNLTGPIGTPPGGRAGGPMVNIEPIMDRTQATVRDQTGEVDANERRRLLRERMMGRGNAPGFEEEES